MLSIKPVLTVEDGEVHLMGKARGSKNGRNLLTKKIEEVGGVDFSMPIELGYAGLDDKLLRKYIADSRALWEEYPGRSCPSIPWAQPSARTWGPAPSRWRFSRRSRTCPGSVSQRVASSE